MLERQGEKILVSAGGDMVMPGVVEQRDTSEARFVLVCLKKIS